MSEDDDFRLDLLIDKTCPKEERRFFFLSTSLFRWETTTGHSTSLRLLNSDSLIIHARVNAVSLFTRKEMAMWMWVRSSISTPEVLANVDGG